MKLWLAVGSLSMLLVVSVVAAVVREAPTGFDNRSNGLVDDRTHQEVDLKAFDEVEQIDDGLGPLYNAQSCRECHQNPVSGAASQVTELRVGHLDFAGEFENPQIPIAHGTEVIRGRSLVNDRAICPNGQFPDSEIQERVPETEHVRTFRLSLNVLGDGFVEAVPDRAFIELARKQREESHGKIHGQVLFVPIVEAPGHTAVGRFGWKDQHASLLSFAGDAYLNEMGITSRLFPDEVTNICNTAQEPNNRPGPDGLDDVEHFARFMRATKAPPRDVVLANTPAAMHGFEVFRHIGCGMCHTPTLTTAPEGTQINGGMFTIPRALGSITFHPFSDFLLHNVGTGDGIVQSFGEHYGRVGNTWMPNVSRNEFQLTRNKIRTAPLWGVRLRPRLMHDGASLTFMDAILRHRGEAEEVIERFKYLGRHEKDDLIEFLKSL